MKKFFAIVFLVINALFSFYLFYFVVGSIIAYWNEITLYFFSHLLPYIIVLISSGFLFRHLLSMKSQQNFTDVIFRGIGGFFGNVLLLIVLQIFIADIF